MSNLRLNVTPFSHVQAETDVLGISRPETHQPEGIVCLAVTKRGVQRWQPLHDVSGSIWVQMRDVVEEEMRLLLLESLNRPPPLPTAPTMKCEPARTTMKDFYMALIAKDPKKAKILLTKHTGPNGLNRRVCVNCFQWKGRGQLESRCIHADCPGMCDECYASKAESKCSDTCRVCARTNRRDCPVCLESKPAEEFNPSETCTHHVCFKCCFRAERSGNPIRKCPLCRGVFTTAQNCAPAWQRNSTSHPHSFLDPSGNLTNSSPPWAPTPQLLPDDYTHPLDYMGDDTINQIAASLFQ